MFFPRNHKFQTNSNSFTNFFFCFLKTIFSSYYYQNCAHSVVLLNLFYYSEKFRRINAWQEFRDNETLTIFYYNDDTGHYQLTKPGPVLENEMRKRAWSLVRRQSPEEWSTLHERSEVLRSVLNFDELRDEETGCVFYCDNRKWPSGRRLKKAQAAQGQENEQEILAQLEIERQQEKVNKALALQNGDDDDDEEDDDDEDIEDESDEEVEEGNGNNDSNNTNNGDNAKIDRSLYDVPPDGTFSWQKPPALNQSEKTDRGRAIAAKQVDEDWAALRLRSKKFRDLCNNEVKEYRDNKTGCTFYYNIITEVSTWDKPIDALISDKSIRGWNLIHKYAGKPIHTHCSGLWAEHADAKTGAIYYRNTTAAEGLAIFDGGCQWAKPDMLVREEEEASERARKGRAMVMYREFDKSGKNWNELAERSTIRRSSYYMHNGGWDELTDKLTGVTVYQKAELNGSVVGSKPTHVQKFDREQFYWYLLKSKSVKARVFNESGWEEYIDSRLKSFLYYHPIERTTQWIRPKLVTKIHSDVAWREQLLQGDRATNIKNAPGHGKRGKVVQKKYLNEKKYLDEKKC